MRYGRVDISNSMGGRLGNHEVASPGGGGELPGVVEIGTLYALAAFHACIEAMCMQYRSCPYTPASIEVVLCRRADMALRVLAWNAQNESATLTLYSKLPSPHEACPSVYDRRPGASDRYQGVRQHPTCIPPPSLRCMHWQLVPQLQNEVGWRLRDY